MRILNQSLIGNSKKNHACTIQLLHTLLSVKGVASFCHLDSKPNRYHWSFSPTQWHGLILHMDFKLLLLSGPFTFDFFYVPYSFHDTPPKMTLVFLTCISNQSIPLVKFFHSDPQWLVLRSPKVLKFAYVSKYTISLFSLCIPDPLFTLFCAWEADLYFFMDWDSQPLQNPLLWVWPGSMNMMEGYHSPYSVMAMIDGNFADLINI